MFVQHQSLSEQGGWLVAKDVGHFIQNEFGMTFKQANIYRLLRQLGFSRMTTILNTPGHVALDRIDVWFQDESRFG